MTKIELTKEQGDFIIEALNLLRDKINSGTYPADEFDYMRNLFHSTFDAVNPAAGDWMDFMMASAEALKQPWEGTMVPEQIEFIDSCREEFKANASVMSDRRIAAEKKYTEYLKSIGKSEKEIFKIIWADETKSADI